MLVVVKILTKANLAEISGANLFAHAEIGANHHHLRRAVAILLLIVILRTGLNSGTGLLHLALLVGSPNLDLLYHVRLLFRTRLGGVLLVVN